MHSRANNRRRNMSRSTIPAAVPRARRLTRPRWRDPRLLIGAVLVLVSLVATTTLVRAVAETTRVWAAAENLVPRSEERRVGKRVGPGGGRTTKKRMHMQREQHSN